MMRMMFSTIARAKGVPACTWRRPDTATPLVLSPQDRLHLQVTVTPVEVVW